MERRFAMSLKEKLMQDLKEAMKVKDTIRKNTIQMTRAAILQVEKDERKELTEEEVLEVIAKQVKQRKDALVEFEKSDRADLIADLNKEVEVLMHYLPEQLSDEELSKIVKQAIDELGISSMKEMGKVMGAVLPKIKGRADGRRVNELVKQYLS